MIGYPAEKIVFLSGFVQGQGQKSEQKHKTKELVEFHNHLHVTMNKSRFSKTKKMKGAMCFEQVQRFILGKEIF